MKKVARGLESRLFVQHSASQSQKIGKPSAALDLFLEMLVSKEELLLLALMIYHQHHLLDISDLSVQHGMRVTPVCGLTSALK